MKKIIVSTVLLVLSSPAEAQNAVPPAAPPSENSASTCRKDDALCIIGEKIKSKDPSLGSRSGASPGFIANQPSDAVVPGGRIDLEFLKKNEVKG